MMKIKRNNKKSGFSLAEIMIALVIVAILMAASAPLVNRRASIDNGFNCYWRSKSSQDSGIYFNDTGRGHVGIGTDTPSQDAILSLKATGEQSNNSIAFFNNNGNIVGKLGISGTNIFISTDDISLGASQNNIILGKQADNGLQNHVLSICGMENTIPLLYGQFSDTINEQILKVNGILFTGTNFNTSIFSSPIENYSLIAQDGILVIDNANPTMATNQVSIEPSLIQVGSSSSSDSSLCELRRDAIRLSYGGAETVALYASTGNIETQGQIQALGNISTTAGDIIANGDGTTGGGNISATGEIKAKGNISTTAGDIIAEGDGTTGGNITATSNIIADGDIMPGQNRYLKLRDINNRSATISAINGELCLNSPLVTVSQSGKLTAEILEITHGTDNSSLGKNLYRRIEAIAVGLSSDIRLKDVVGGTKYGLDQVRKMEIVEYKFKDEKKHGEGVRFGVIAQDLQKIMPESVVENKDGFLSIRQNNIFFVAINAIKQLDKEIQNIKQLLNLDELKLDCGKLSSLKIVAQINKLKDENKELKNEIKLLKEQNANLEKRLDDIELMMLSK